MKKAAGVDFMELFAALNHSVSNLPILIRTSRRGKDVRVNQRRLPEFGGLFRLLRRFDLDMGDAASIVISSAGTGRCVIVDVIPIPMKSLSLFRYLIVCCAVASAFTDDQLPMKLWYPKPAKEWTEALPIGKGETRRLDGELLRR